MPVTKTVAPVNRPATNGDTLAAAKPAEAVTDAQASAQLRLLFSNYIASKKRRPKAPSESKAMPALIYDEAKLQPMLDDFIEKWHNWLAEMKNLMLSIQCIGKANPSACFNLTSKSGRPMSVNGNALFSALTREESEILGGKLTVQSVTKDNQAAV